jgi:hypothetical protein
MELLVPPHSLRRWQLQSKSKYLDSFNIKHRKPPKAAVSFQKKKDGNTHQKKKNR